MPRRGAEWWNPPRGRRARPRRPAGAHRHPDARRHRVEEVLAAAAVAAILAAALTVALVWSFR